MVFQANHGLVARQGRKRCADRGDSLNQAGMNSAVDDSVRLPMVSGNLHFSNDFVGGGAKEMNSHGSVPAAGASVDRRRNISVRSGGKAGSSGHSDFFLLPRT